MKANVAPDNIYIPTILAANTVRYKEEGSIEYTRTDALPHWKKSALPNDNTAGFNSDYFCHNGYCINYKELFEKLPKED